MERLKHMYGYVLGIVLSGLGFGFASVANAQDIECGTEYTVKAGDYLTNIARRVYQEPDSYKLIYDSNLEAIGEDPEFICPGLVLEIPCVENDVIKTAVQNNIASASIDRDAGNSPFRIALYHQWAPFLDEKSESGGMLTEIVRRALEESTDKPAFKMHFVSDFKFILNPLLVDHAYDMSVGHTKPNCEAFDDLSEESQFRCNSLDWSQPLYEEVIGYHSLNGMPTLNQHSDLFGKSICRPDGYSTADMDVAGVKEPAIEMVRPATPADCVAAVIDGKADYAALSTDVVQGLAKELDVESLIKVHEPLNHVSTVHVVTAKSHPQAQSMLQVVDNGLDKLKNSGEWFNIVRSHLVEHRASLK